MRQMFPKPENDESRSSPPETVGGCSGIEPMLVSQLQLFAEQFGTGREDPVVRAHQEVCAHAAARSSRCSPKSA